MEANGTDTARCALTAGFVHGEFEEELGKVHHTGVFVHDDQTAGAHHGACLDEVVVVDRGIDEGSRETSAGRTAGLGSLELLAVRNAAADLLYDLTQGGAHRDFHKTGVLDLAAECEHLGALGGFGTHGGEPIRAL